MQERAVALHQVLAELIRAAPIAGTMRRADPIVPGPHVAVAQLAEVAHARVLQLRLLLRGFHRYSMIESHLFFMVY